MTGVLVALEQRLRDGGFTGPIALGVLPDEPDAILVLREYPVEPGLDFSASGLPALERFGVQMVARGNARDGVVVPEAMAWSAYRILAGRHARVQVGGDTHAIDYIFPNHAPAPLGEDDLFRPVYVLNWTIQRWGTLEATA